MSLFDDLVVEMGVPALMEPLGSSVTYTDAAGSDTSLTGMVEAEETEVVETLDGYDTRQVRQVTIATDPDGDYGGVASPAVKATVTIDSVQYAVEEIASKSASFVTLKLVRLRVQERTRPDYRVRPGR